MTPEEEKAYQEGFDFAIQVVRNIIENLEDNTIGEFEETLYEELELLRTDG